MAHLCLVAGEASGDAHGARLIHALRRLDPLLRFSALGGEEMRKAGATLLQDLTQAAAIGPFDAAAHVGKFSEARRRFIRHLAQDRPDAVVFIDFGDFNLPILAPLAKRSGCRVLYYVSPQIWAWGRFRLRWVRKFVDRMIVLFKFEERFYADAGVPVTWVGHPLSDEPPPGAAPRDALLRQLGLNPWRLTIGLLPGSREREISRHLPLLLDAARRIAWQMPGAQFFIPKAPQAAPLAIPARYRGLEIVVGDNRMREGLRVMDAAIVASGTATLEAALAGVPMAVVYRTSWPTYLAARTVLRVPHIAIVNVIAGRAVVPEFVQHRARPRRIARALIRLLRSPQAQQQMRSGLTQVREQLGPPGAVERAAITILQELKLT